MAKQPIIGLDEVGRGAWAGPLLVVAVELAQAINGLNDSKKLTKQRRQLLTLEIQKAAHQIGYGWVEASEIDSNGLTKAMQLACERAVESLYCTGRAIIIDGATNYLPQYKQVQTVIRADGSVPAVSAASIVAKVTRDQLMRELDDSLPGLNFAEHGGYGTTKHRRALLKLGVPPQHRKSFKPVKAIASKVA